MARIMWRVTSMLLLVTTVFSVGGLGNQLVLCVPTEGTPAVEFVTNQWSVKGAACPHEGCESALSVMAKPACDDHHAGCVDIPLAFATTGIPIKSLRAQAPQPLSVRCPLPVAEVARPLASLPATLPPRGDGFLASLRTVVLLT